MAHSIRLFLALITAITYFFISFISPFFAYAQPNNVQTWGRTVNAKTVPFQVKLYVVKKGDTLEKIERKYNISRTGLCRLNKGKYFSKNAKYIKPGTTLIVPSRPLTKAQSRHLDQGQYTQYIAELASNMGKNFSPSSLRQNIKAGLLNHTNASLSTWFNKYGTANIDMDIDDNFSLKNAQIDALFPIWENGNILLFTQGDVHRSDARTQGNFGLGGRYFFTDFAIGANSFLDYDFTQKHARMGLGLEIWRDYVKFALNGYIALTDWKKSAQIDYNARPANGWDLRADAYLPFYPHLGFNIYYEKYYGLVSILDGKKKAQDPSALTLGVHYTPIPLLTFNLDHVRGEQEHSTRFGLQATYRFGVPLAAQLDQDNVAALRSLAGQRYDLVSRNNNIILAYKRCILIHIVPEIRGEEGQEYALFDDVTLNQDWKLTEKTIDLKDAFVNNQGSLSQECGQVSTLKLCTVTLPKFNNAQGAELNPYKITFVVKNNKTQATKKVMTTLYVEKKQLNVAHSSFSAQNTKLDTGSKNTTQVTFTAKSARNQPIENIAGILKFNIHKIGTSEDHAQEGIVLTTPNETEAGIYVSTLTASAAGTYEITPSMARGDTRLDFSAKKLTIHVASSEIDERESTLILSDRHIKLTKDTHIRITFKPVTVKDGGAAIDLGDTLSFVVHSGEKLDSSSKLGKITENPKGTYISTLTVSTPGEYKITPVITKGTQISSLDGLTQSFSVVLDTIDKNKSHFNIDKSELPSTLEDYTPAQTIIQFTPKNAADKNVLFGQEKLFFCVKDETGTIVKKLEATKDSRDTYQATFETFKNVHGKSIETYTIIPMLGNKELSDFHKNITINANLSKPYANNTTLKSSHASAPADGETSIEISFRAKDYFGIPQDDIKGKLFFKPEKAELQTLIIGPSLKRSLEPGVYKVIVRSKSVGTYMISVYYKDSQRQDIKLKQIQLKFKSVDKIQEAKDYSKLNIPNKTLSTDGGTGPHSSATLVSFEALDAQDRPNQAISAEDITFMVQNGNYLIEENKRPAIIEKNKFSIEISDEIISKLDPSNLTVKITPCVMGTPIGRLEQIITFDPELSVPDEYKSEVNYSQKNPKWKVNTSRDLFIILKDRHSITLKKALDSVEILVKKHIEGQEDAECEDAMETISTSISQTRKKFTLKALKPGKYKILPVYIGERNKKLRLLDMEVEVCE